MLIRCLHIFAGLLLFVHTAGGAVKLILALSRGGWLTIPLSLLLGLAAELCFVIPLQLIRKIGYLTSLLLYHRLGLLLRCFC